MSKKEIETDVVEEESALETLLKSPKKIFSNILSLIKFGFSVITVLITLFFSAINIILKVSKAGWSPSTYILTAAAGLYLLLLVFYYILLKLRLSGGNAKSFKEFIYYFKYFIKILKVAVPIILLFNLIGNPVYDFFVMFFSSISIFFGLISFIIATSRMVHRTKKHVNNYNKNKK